jgi:N-acetylglucosamine repressor
VTEYIGPVAAPQPTAKRARGAKVDRNVMRDVNRTLVLHVIRDEGPMSRSDVARRTALAKPTVSGIVDNLVGEGLLREIGKGDATAAGGRRPTILEFDASSTAFAAIHFGVSTLTVAVGDGLGRPLATVARPSVHGNARTAIKRVRKMLDEACADAQVPFARLRGVAAAVPGLIDRTTGTCVVAPNLGWRDVPVQAALEKALGVPSRVYNIAQAAAVAEGRVGVARGVSSYVWVYVGSGIGAAVVTDGRLFYGMRGFAGEIGHCPVADEGPVCGCGRVGCLETFASGPAIARSAVAALLDRSRQSALRGLRDVSAQDVAAAAQQGDAVALAILANAGELLGRGVSYLVNVLNPEMVVVGGRVAQAGDALLEPLRASVRHHALDAEQVPIVPSVLAERAEITGALLLAMDLDSLSDSVLGPRAPGDPSPPSRA